MLLFITQIAVVLSVCIGVGIYLYPIYSRTSRDKIDSRQLTKSAQSYASSAKDMTDLIICEMVMIAPLLGGFYDSSVTKKFPPLLIRVPYSER